MSKSFIALSLTLALGLFGGGAYFHNKVERVALHADSPITQVAAALNTFSTPVPEPIVTPTPSPTSAPTFAPVVTETPSPTPTPTPEAVRAPAKSEPITLSPFTRDLQVGSKGTDVKTLQILLNKSGFKIAASGAGSPGKETTLFGASTASALQKLQCDRGVVCSGTGESTGYGMANEETRQILNALYNLTNTGVKTKLPKK